MARIKRPPLFHQTPEERRRQRKKTPPPTNPAVLTAVKKRSAKKTKKPAEAPDPTAIELVDKKLQRGPTILKLKLPKPASPTKAITRSTTKAAKIHDEGTKPAERVFRRSDGRAETDKEIEEELADSDKKKLAEKEQRAKAQRIEEQRSFPQKVDIAREQILKEQRFAKQQQLAHRPLLDRRGQLVAPAPTFGKSRRYVTSGPYKGCLLPQMGTDFGDGDEADTIRVQYQAQAQARQAANDDDDSPLSDLEELSRREDALKAKTSRSKGKEPAREDEMELDEEDLAMLDDPLDTEDEEEEQVDEGSVDFNDHSPSEHEVEDDFEEIEAASKVVITLDSDDENDTAKNTAKQTSSNAAPAQNDTTDLLEYPWRDKDFSLASRRHWETMFSQVEMRPMSALGPGGSWANTEDYQREKDLEMLRYIKDFPIAQWVIGAEQAEQAYFRLLERSRWRKLGIKIYGNQRIPEIIPNSTPFSRSSSMGGGMMQGGGMGQGGMGQMNPSAYQPPFGGGRQPTVPQQMSQRPPSTLQGGMGPPPGRGYMPQPEHVLRSQPNAMPMATSPGHGLPGQHQPHPHSHQYMMAQAQPPPPFGHPQHVGGPHGMPYQLNQHGYPIQYPQFGHADVPMRHPQPTMPGQMGFGMPGMGMPPQGMPNQMMHGHGPAPAAPASKGRKKKETPPAGTPPPPPPTPPYDKHDRPVERKKFNKTGKKNMRKQAEAEEFPWHRDMDFKKAREEATWDTSGYDDRILDAMAEVRRLNAPIITKLDIENSEKQKASRGRKSKKAMGDVPAAGDGDDGEEEDGVAGPSTVRLNPRKKGENIGGDPYYSGNYSFATENDRQKALALQRKTPDEIIDAAAEGKIDWELCKEIMICWNPGKKGTTQELVQATFRIYDNLITHKQLTESPVITRRAAECIIDFCPHLLWRETLLRITSEAGCGNKDVRDRFCYNGCYADKATVTKRIAAALGQKQLNTASRKNRKDNTAEGTPSEEPMMKGKKRGPPPKSDAARYLEGEEEWHNQNKLDFDAYINFFGKRSGHHRIAGGGKRKKRDGEDGDGDGGVAGSGSGSGEEGSSSKRQRTEEPTSPISSELSDVLSEPEEESEDDEDAVSEQSDGILDEIED